ncbi:MAG: polyhydroxyalkanoic acid system family protein [Ignavibacteriaceae bacterium]|jgi:Putative polyhydroxyalkanoic acid system protein (PHA_gran_rgn).|nr:MAG: hypothetical protein EDM69_06250 [Chlorobiota bacterium]KXK06475.1 MAG: putative polyhydroxyalkanoic acid system protein [Chlorobi bacterium OLB4]MBV6399711.1 hypothetical protein [Ignavibacteria bacterium]MCC6885227.1 polyhydroxyalkanoic acid system family protein [Ignavibacteriales bacterium]MCE7953370.1 hypothetical protein [Chlorobi bacterium CHB7]MDL1887214.1 hypothetical protein [Ignavibacteria bacterium CHB1]MEB2330547.1 polyhydroxyalkanoic acid system family protein [Ignavibac
MSYFEINYPHKLGANNACEKIRSHLKKLNQEYSDVITQKVENWNGNHGKIDVGIKGFKISCDIEVNDESVKISGDLPPTLFFFRGSIKQKIEEELSEILS